MAKAPRTQSSKSKRASGNMRTYRARLRRQGLRPIQIWVPDTKAPGFAEAIRRQSLLVSQSPGEQRDIAFIEGLLAENFDLPRI